MACSHLRVSTSGAGGNRGTGDGGVGERGDDVIEYLLHKDRGRCSSIMARVRVAEGRERLQGLPELWAAVLEEFGRDEALADISEALLRHVKRRSDPAIYEQAAKRYLKWIVDAGIDDTFRQFRNGLSLQFLGLLMRHQVVEMAVAANKLADELAGGEMFWLSKHAPRVLILEAGKRLNVLREIESAIMGIPERQPMGVSLMLATNPDWQPAGWKMVRLSGAYAANARWKGIDLSGCDLCGADLAGADLTECSLDGVIAKGSEFQ